MRRVSVLIATFNRLRDLYGCLSSLERQRGDLEIEACIVNDGGVSIDPVLEAFSGSSLRIQWLNAKENNGQVEARNRALGLASGDYIALCDDDDRWLPHHVESLLQAVQDEDVALSYTDTELVWLSRTETGFELTKRAPFAWGGAEDMLRRYNPIAPSSVLYRRELHERIGAFDENIGHYWDWDFWLRSLEDGHIARVDACHTLYGIYADSSNLSANPLVMSPFLKRLIAKHQLGDLPSSNFSLMLDDEAIVPLYQSSTHIAWNGDMTIWTPKHHLKL